MDWLTQITDRPLQDAVRRFVTSGCLTRAGSTDISHPSCTWGECWRLAQALQGHLEDTYETWLPLGSGVPGCLGPTAEQLGLTDRLNEGCETHYWAVVRANADHVYAIDLSATQYGYSQPLVLVGDGSQAWAAADDVPPLPRLTLAEIIANREAAGFTGPQLDVRGCDVWIDAHGTRWACAAMPDMHHRWQTVDAADEADIPALTAAFKGEVRQRWQVINEDEHAA